MKLLKYQPHQKITYSAGLISLVLLPVLCLGWLYQHKAFEEKGVINVMFFNPELNKTLPKNLQITFPIKRDYAVINLDGNDHYDKISLQYARVLLNRWKAAKDTIHGIHFHFGVKSKYWTFVEAINIFKAVELYTYMPYKNDMYAFYSNSYFETSLLQKDWVCLLCNDVIPLPPDNINEIRWHEKLVFFKYVIKEYWSPLVVFILMLILTLHNLKKQRPSLRIETI